MTENQDSDSFLTLAAPAFAEIKILGSRFLGFAAPIQSADAFLAWLGDIKKKYYDATHHCFAYRLKFDGSEFRYSDDGEPSGTAGKRILGSIDRLGLTDTGVIVVRYFGGTKLGVGGLARAYTDSADAAFAEAQIERRYVMYRLGVRFPYDVTSQVHHVIESFGVDVEDRIYGNDVLYQILLRESLIERFREEVTEFTQRTAEFNDPEPL